MLRIVNIDINNEKLIAISDVPSYIPRRPNGKKVHISAIYRWASKGIKGVVIETAKIGGSTYTSLEALQRFSEHLTVNSKGPGHIEGTPVSRRRQIDLAAQRASIELGFSPEGSIL